MASRSVPSNPPLGALHHDLIAAAKNAALKPAERWAFAKVMASHFLPLLVMAADLPAVIYDHIYDSFLMYLRFVGDPAITRYIMEAIENVPSADEIATSRAFAIVTGQSHPDEARFND